VTEAPVRSRRDEAVAKRVVTGNHCGMSKLQSFHLELEKGSLSEIDSED
jgi:hypothetical protein